MDFKELMKQNMAMLDSWKSSKEYQEYFEGDEEAMKLAFLHEVQQAIGADFKIITQSDHMDEMLDYHNSMEGLI